MKKILLVAVLVISVHAANSQRFIHGVGFGAFVVDAPLTDIGGFATFTYSPRYNVYQTEVLSVSLGIPLNAGFAGTYTYESYGGYAIEENTLRFMVNAPLMVNFNMGAGSSKQNDKRFGFFLGAGFGLHYGDYGVTVIENNYEYYDTRYGTSFGPAANAGFRIAVGKKHKDIETRFSYMKGISGPEPAVFGLGALFNF